MDPSLDFVDENEKDKGNDGEDSQQVVDPYQMWQRWRQRLLRRSSLRDQEIVGEFDVAIVLTGLNDV